MTYRPPHADMVEQALGQLEGFPTEFGIRQTARGLFISFDPFGRHISGTGHRLIEAAQGEIVGWASAMKMGRFSWKIVEAGDDD